MNILFVDDSISTCEVFSIFFKRANHTVRCANDGAEAMRAVEQEQFDAIVLDLEMPGVDGWDALHGIRELPHGGRVPIVLYSGSAMFMDCEMAAEAGADVVIQKPVVPQELLCRLELLAA